MALPVGTVTLPAPVVEGELRAPKPEAPDVFGDLLAQANKDSLAAGKAAEAFAAGALDDIHGTLIASQKAGIAVKLATSVRNKVVDAFYELWRMNV